MYTKIFTFVYSWTRPIIGYRIELGSFIPTTSLVTKIKHIIRLELVGMKILKCKSVHHESPLERWLAADTEADISC